MGTYRVEWPCCGSVTETDSWEPESCPFCAPADGSGVVELKAINATLLDACEEALSALNGAEYALPGHVVTKLERAIAKATGSAQ